MAMEAPIRCAVITPEQQVLDIEATDVVFPAHDGLLGVLKNRAPLVCELGIGVLKIGTPTGSRELFIDGGFAQVLHNEVSILTQRAVPAEDASRSDAEKALAEAAAMPIRDDASFESRQAAIARAKTLLKVARK